MNIAFDLDRIFINYPPFVPAKLIDYLHRDYSKKTLSYRIPKSPLDKLFRRLIHCRFIRPKIEKNIEFIHNFPHNPHSHKIYLISSRYKVLEDITWKRLKKYDLIAPFDEIFLNTHDLQPHLFKERLLKQLKIDLYIDDNLDILRYLKKHCPATILLWYNPYTKEASSDISTITSLDQIRAYLR